MRHESAGTAQCLLAFLACMLIRLSLQTKLWQAKKEGVPDYTA